MALTDFGKTVRKARLDAGETLLTMAKSLNVSAAFLSAMETGRKKISEEWVNKICLFFNERGIDVEKLRVYADISNKSVSIDGCDPDTQILIAGFLRSDLDAETLAKVNELAKIVGQKYKK
ncbi:helix-turn-helix domain-containing protein [Nitrosomonas communis]|uniref:Helix-turn-helix domain-containing protein n=1 Tax=Nitrosomonas communis TaxID=44574 RepID=A0A1I4RUS2_9PROT|nr:helix-turn-helix transcriptional regulator [Nitrosomonas communis]SFM55988.1 Helix-turn-helix domain-containing protein [Nitrosomonas communis]